MSKLKPCPFCGIPYPYITFERGYIDDSTVVFCNACKISVKLEENDQEGFNDVAKEKAIEAWNRRASIEPERKTGKWTKVTDRYGINGESVWRCSSCLEMTICKGDYCPNCGADMRGDKHETD